MFTGLIGKIGSISQLRTRNKGAVLEIEHPAWEPALEIGESIAVSGICLTAVACAADKTTFDVLNETLSRTCLARKRCGALVNLERALRAQDRVGGHFVTGHVDGTAKVAEMRGQGADRILRLECEEDISEQIVAKGSVACDGVSLTVTMRQGSYFEVNLVRHTWQNTSLKTLSCGDVVNIETDMIGKYVRAYLGISGNRPGKKGIESALKEAGFV